MYNFIDTNDNFIENKLPSEALRINGVWIEEKVAGYRTLSVKGRESLSVDLTSFDDGRSDGVRFVRKRYPGREITVKYQLIASTSEEFRESYNKLIALFDEANQELVFNDEKAYFFTGTMSEMGSVPEGTNAVISTITFTCTDPFKYELDYTVVEAEDVSSLDIDADIVACSPCIIEIMPKADMPDYVIQGLARDDLKGELEEITVKNLKDATPVIIDGEKQLITELGSNKFNDSAFWHYPTLTPGLNVITTNRTSVRLTVKYRKRWL